MWEFADHNRRLPLEGAASPQVGLSLGSRKSDPDRTPADKQPPGFRKLSLSLLIAPCYYHAGIKWHPPVLGGVTLKQPGQSKASLLQECEFLFLPEGLLRLAIFQMEKLSLL